MTEMSPAALAAGIAQAARTAGETTPAVRGADARTGQVTAVGTDGTVDIGTIRARRLDTYATPVVGDVVLLVQGSSGSWWAAGRTAAAADPPGTVRVAVKTADTSRVSTNTVTDDPHLSFSVSANATYIVDGWVKYSAVADGDITIDWGVPSGALGEWTGHGAGLATTAQTTNGYSIRTESNDVSQGRNFSGTTASNDLTVLIAGTLRTQTEGGTYALQWAQGNVNTSPTIVYTDSWIRLTRVS